MSLTPEQNPNQSPNDLEPNDLIAAVQNGSLPDINHLFAESSDAVLGVDYIIDYYAVLEISAAASEHGIDKAYQKKILGCHPDRVALASDDIKRQASKQFALFSEARDCLKDPARRTMLDQQLQEFDSKLISTDGTPIINLGRKRVNISYLLTGDDGGVRKRHNLLVEQFSGHNEQVFNAFKLLMQQVGDQCTTEQQQAYFDLLVQKYVHLQLKENSLWEEAGITNQDEPDYTSPEEFLEKQLLQITETRDLISARVEMKLVEYHRNPQLLLEYSGTDLESSGDTEIDLEAITENLIERALNHYDQIKDQLEEIFQERVQVMEEILKLTPWNYLGEDKDHQTLLVLLCHKEKLAFPILFSLGESSITPTALESERFKNFSTSKLAEEIDDLLKVVDPGTSIISLDFNAELPPMLQAVNVASQHYERILEN